MRLAGCQILANFAVEAFLNADWADRADLRGSEFGFCFVLFRVVRVFSGFRFKE